MGIFLSAVRIISACFTVHPGIARMGGGILGRISVLLLPACDRTCVPRGHGIFSDHLCVGIAYIFISVYDDRCDGGGTDRVA